MNGHPAAALIAFYAVLLCGAVVSAVYLRTRPGIVTGLAAATHLSLLVVVPWAFLANLTIGPAPPLRLTWHDLPGSYARLAAGPTGNAAELATAVIAITVLCLLLARHRKARLAAGDAPAALRSPPAAGPGPAPHSPARVPALAYSRAGRPAYDHLDGEP